MSLEWLSLPTPKKTEERARSYENRPLFAYSICFGVVYQQFSGGVGDFMGMVFIRKNFWLGWNFLGESFPGKNFTLGDFYKVGFARNVTRSKIYKKFVLLVLLCCWRPHFVFGDDLGVSSKEKIQRSRTYQGIFTSGGLSRGINSPWGKYNQEIFSMRNSLWQNRAVPGWYFPQRGIPPCLKKDQKLNKNKSFFKWK